MASRRFRRVRLDELTSEEFAAAARADPVVLLPVGALEEHGRHLPLGADMIQPMHILDEVARRTGGYVAPPVPYGVCTTTRPYPGTVSVSVDALKAFVRDILADLVRNGIRRVMIVSGHAGREHMMALRAAAQEVVDQGSGLKATVLSDYDIIYASQGILPEGDGHAGAGETSRILTARPDLVKGRSPPGTNAIPPYAVVDDPRKYWPGVTGDPSKASKALGEKLDELVIEELVKLVEELRRRA
jgi:creatinine amidohydrolase